MKIYVSEIKLDPEKVKEYHNLSQGGVAQKFLESEVIRRCEPYVPFDKGILAGSAHPYPEPGGGAVKWDGPYAHYQFMGEVYGPNIPKFDKDDPSKVVGWFSPPGVKKNPTGRQLSYNLEKHPQAGSHWDARMMANEGDALVEDVAKLVGGIVKRS